MSEGWFVYCGSCPASVFNTVAVTVTRQTWAWSVYPTASWESLSHFLSPPCHFPVQSLLSSENYNILYSPFIACYLFVSIMGRAFYLRRDQVPANMVSATICGLCARRTSNCTTHKWWCTFDLQMKNVNRSTHFCVWIKRHHEGNINVGARTDGCSGP